MKAVFIIAIVLCAALFCAPVHAYILPSYSISQADDAAPSEDALARCRAELSAMDANVRLKRLDEHEKNPKISLTNKERAAAGGYKKLKAEIDFWKRVVALKGSLLRLKGDRVNQASDAEADRIAKDVIATLYELSEKWRVGNSALIRNFLINVGAREKGFCYQYVEELRRPLVARQWKEFDIRWGTAWKGDFRENNALVVTSRGSPFEEGLAIDAWRTAGKPFWTPVKGDRFPWKEEFDIE